MGNKKEFITFEVGEELDWTLRLEIKKIKEDLEELEKLGATYIRVDVVEDYDMTFIKVKGYTDRFETDAEFQDRIFKEKQHKKEIKRKELAELERLKLKYKNANL